MISPVYVVTQLCKMMGACKGTYGIEWSLDRDLGYRTIINGVGLYLAEYQGLHEGPRLYLFLFKDGAKTQIVEPPMLLSVAPIGKFLRRATLSMGIDPWPKLLETPAEKANEELRIDLNKLYERASEQDDLRVAGAFLGEDLRKAITKGTFKKDFFMIPECDEVAKQQLFRELLRLKPITV